MAKAGRILVTGCRGQLGADLLERLPSEYEVTGIDLPELDICNRDQLIACARAERPDVIIHAAAYTDVDGCEADRETAFTVNAEGTRNVALASSTVGAYLIYYSTDYVFDGEKPSAYVETDVPDPQSIYGQSKLAGERAVREQLDRYAILRIAWLYGRYGGNFIKTMLRLGQQQLGRTRTGERVSALKVVDDQFGNPTWTKDVVSQTAELLRNDWRGVFHATSEGEVTWYEFARLIFDSLDLPVNFRPCTTEEYPRPAPRPRRSSLENARLKQVRGNRMRDFREALDEFLNTYGRELIG